MNLAKLWQKIRSRSEPAAPNTATPAIAPLSDADCDFLFNQLLEGVAHGWDGGRVEQFFDHTRDRAKISHWLDWLQRYGERLTTAATPDPELAKRLEQLAAQVQRTPHLVEFGASAQAIAQQLRTRQTTGVVWEYDGPDSIFSRGTPQEPLTTPGQPGVETLTLDELFERLQIDPELRRRIAAQVGVESDDPLVIVQALAVKLRPPGT
ncbi:MAG: hypothetical protein HC910_11995 [Spirulinaceae cyanobacterium SM2_1_0]|nr:hypothetical protein [Spirulinaceae cyanobacterium SM2_1_0]